MNNQQTNDMNPIENFDDFVRLIQERAKNPLPERVETALRLCADEFSLPREVALTVYMRLRLREVSVPEMWDEIFGEGAHASAMAEQLRRKSQHARRN